MVCLFTAAQPGPDWALMDGESERERERDVRKWVSEQITAEINQSGHACLRFLSVLLRFTHLFPSSVFGLLEKSTKQEHPRTLFKVTFMSYSDIHSLSICFFVNDSLILFNIDVIITSLLLLISSLLLWPFEFISLTHDFCLFTDF